MTDSAVFQLADVDRNGAVDAGDIDLLTEKVRTGGDLSEFDLNHDGALNDADRRFWIESLKRTYFGDADLDGQFGTGDFIPVFQAGFYESPEKGLATWATGDWNGDGKFNTTDLVVSFQEGGFEKGPRPMLEPSIEVRSDNPLSTIVQLVGRAEPFALVQVRGDTPVVGADERGQFRIDTDLAHNASPLIVTFSDLNGHQLDKRIELQRTPPSIDDIIAYAPWGEFITRDVVFPELPRSIVTALTPMGVSRLSLADNPLTKDELKPDRYKVGPSDEIDRVTEDTTRNNDEPQNAQLIAGLGVDPDQTDRLVIHGELEPTPTELFPVEDDGDLLHATETGLSSTPNQAIVARAVIGDGRFGSGGSGTGDFDFYAIRGVQQDQIITIDINTPSTSELDSFIYVWNSSGQTIDVNDDGDNTSDDSFLDFKIPADGDYYVSVAGYGSFAPVDPFDSSSGFAAGSEGDYEIIIGVNLDQAADTYSVDLQPGDILGASAFGGARHLTLRGPDGDLLMGSGQDVTFVHPEASPLPGGGNASISWVADTAGTYSLAVDGGVGQYDIETAMFRPVLESADRGERQILFLDFDGASLDAESLFEMGNSSAELSPLSSFLAAWGLGESDEDAVIDAVTAVVRENFADIGARGLNGDRAIDGIDGHYEIEIVTSRDSRDALGFKVDPFGADNVSRVIVGGSIEELGIQTIGIAEAVDVGNFDTSDTAVVLLDLLSGPASSPNSLNQYEISDLASKIDLVGVGVGNIVTHEAGHFFAGWHSDQLNPLAVIMDQGGNLSNTVGVGDDGVFGTADDVDVDFGSDTFVPNEGFTGTSNTLNAIAFGLSTGTIDKGMVIVNGTPSDNEQLTTRPNEFAIRFIDDFAADALPAADQFTVNGIPADLVRVSGPRELTFEYSQSPVLEQGLQVMNLAAGAVVRSSDSAPSQPFAGTFGYDALLMQVTAVTPAQPTVTLALNEVVVTVNEPYDPSSIGTDDLELSQGRVTGYQLVDDQTIQYDVEGIVSEGMFDIAMPDGALADAFGNRGTGFQQSHLLDIGNIPFSAPQIAKLPLGSAGYESTMSGGITAGDVDAFAFSVDPGQTLSLVLRPDEALRGSIELWSRDRLISSASAAAAGEAVLLQTEDVSGQLVGRRENVTDFEVRVSGLEASAGSYSIQILLNAIWEEESFGGPTNDTDASAESIEASFLELGPQAAQRAAILGDLAGGKVVFDGFENGTLGDSWTTSSSTNFGRTRVTDEYGAANGAFALLMDVSVPLDNLNEAIWQVDLAGVPNPILTFSHANFDDERDPFSGDFDGSFSADGVAVSNDGISWSPIFDAPNTEFGVWKQHFIDLTSATASTGIDLDGPLFIKFQQFDNSPLVADGRGWDDVAIRRKDAEDWYRFEARQRDSVEVALNAFSDGAVAVDLFDSNGTLVAEGLDIHRPLTNGSFEAGDFRGWTVETTGSTNRPWQVTESNKGGGLFIDSTSAQDGQLVAWNGFDGDGPMQYRMFQDVSIPADANVAELSWQYRAQWTFFVNAAQARTLELQVVDPSDGRLLETLHRFSTGTELEAPSGDTGWVTLKHDLASYAGSSVRLLFVEDVPESFTGPAQIEFDGIKLDLAQDLPTNVDDMIRNYVVPSGGTYYVRVTGDPLTNYSLVTTRNATFSIERLTETAQPLTSTAVQGRQWLLGYLDDSDRDLYEVRLSPGQPLTIETQTPADGAGQFANELDPIVRLYNSAGELVAEDDNSGANDINAFLRYRVPRDAEGVYTLEVASAGGSTGEYIVSIQGADAPEALFEEVAAAVAAIAAGEESDLDNRALADSDSSMQKEEATIVQLNTQLVDSVLAEEARYDLGWRLDDLLADDLIFDHPREDVLLADLAGTGC